MNNLDSRITESYDRLTVGSTVYLLRNSGLDYGQLPDPGSVERVFKADVRQIDPDYRRGVNLVDWFNLQERVDPDGEEGPLYALSSREVFKLGELNAVILDRTELPKPIPGKLDKLLGSTGGRFGKIVAAAMAEVILERFADDLRDSSGHLVEKR